MVKGPATTALKRWQAGRRRQQRRRRLAAAERHEVLVRAPALVTAPHLRGMALGIECSPGGAALAVAPQAVGERLLRGLQHHLSHHASRPGRWSTESRRLCAHVSQA